MRSAPAVVVSCLIALSVGAQTSILTPDLKAVAEGKGARIRRGGGVGLWVGPGQGGYFANLKITPAR